MKEEWQDIKGYEGKYQISNMGNVKSIHYKKSKEINERILKPRFVTRKGHNYYYVVLSKDNIPHTFKIHRLVAEYFIPNPQNKPVVNHKDGNKQNNKVENLEWCTVAENNRHCYNVLGKHPMKGYKFDKNKNSKPVSQFYISEEGYKYHIATYVSIKAAALINNLCARSISHCCNGNTGYQSVGGYVWKFTEKEEWRCFKKCNLIKIA